MIEYKTTKDISKEELFSLYNDAKWEGYTKDMDKLQRALKNSNTVISAWLNNILIGLVRTISDDETIVYIQDVLVLEKFKKHRIGTMLIQKILEQSKDIRQIVLLTDGQDKVSRSFYETLDFSSCDDGKLVAFIKN